MFLAHSNENDTLHILTDSKLTALLIEHGAHARANKALVQAVRHKYWLARTTRRVRVRWLPAHIGLRGNEDADALADEGARLSAQGVGYTPAQLRARIYNRTFYGPSDKQNTQPRDFFNRPIPTAKRKRPPAPLTQNRHATDNPAPNRKRQKQLLLHPLPAPTPTAPTIPRSNRKHTLRPANNVPRYFEVVPCGHRPPPTSRWSRVATVPPPPPPGRVPHLFGRSVGVSAPARSPRPPRLACRWPRAWCLSPRGGCGVEIPRVCDIN